MGSSAQPQVAAHPRVPAHPRPAASPAISDPGFRLVRAALEANVRVAAVPGPSAAIAAISIAGIPTDRFTFEGFVPARDATRGKSLDELRREPRTMVFYEAARRLAEPAAMGHLFRLHEARWRAPKNAYG